MRHPQLLILQGDQRLTALLEPAAEAARWRVRKPHDLAECLETLPHGGPKRERMDAMHPTHIAA